MGKHRRVFDVGSDGMAFLRIGEQSCVHRRIVAFGGVAGEKNFARRGANQSGGLPARYFKRAFALRAETIVARSVA